MADFESGVSAYIYGQATVEVAFPVDKKGNADISCNQCWYYRRASQSCALNGKICAYPNKYVGDYCPLEIVTDPREITSPEAEDEI